MNNSDLGINSSNGGSPKYTRYDNQSNNQTLNPSTNSVVDSPNNDLTARKAKFAKSFKIAAIIAGAGTAATGILSIVGATLAAFTAIAFLPYTAILALGISAAGLAIATISFAIASHKNKKAAEQARINSQNPNVNPYKTGNNSSVRDNDASNEAVIQSTTNTLNSSFASTTPSNSSNGLFDNPPSDNNQNSPKSQAPVLAPSKEESTNLFDTQNNEDPVNTTATATSNTSNSLSSSSSTSKPTSDTLLTSDASKVKRKNNDSGKNLSETNPSNSSVSDETKSEQTEINDSTKSSAKNAVIPAASLKATPDIKIQSNKEPVQKGNFNNFSKSEKANSTRNKKKTRVLHSNSSAYSYTSDDGFNESVQNSNGDKETKSAKSSQFANIRRRKHKKIPVNKSDSEYDVDGYSPEYYSNNKEKIQKLAENFKEAEKQVQEAKKQSPSGEISTEEKLKIVTQVFNTQGRNELVQSRIDNLTQLISYGQQARSPKTFDTNGSHLVDINGKEVTWKTIKPILEQYPPEENEEVDINTTKKKDSDFVSVAEIQALEDNDADIIRPLIEQELDKLPQQELADIAKLVLQQPTSTKTSRDGMTQQNLVLYIKEGLEKKAPQSALISRLEKKQKELEKEIQKKQTEEANNVSKKRKRKKSKSGTVTSPKPEATEAPQVKTELTLEDQSKITQIMNNIDALKKDFHEHVGGFASKNKKPGKVVVPFGQLPQNASKSSIWLQQLSLISTINSTEEIKLPFEKLYNDGDKILIFKNQPTLQELKSLSPQELGNLEIAKLDGNPLKVSDLDSLLKDDSDEIKTSDVKNIIQKKDTQPMVLDDIIRLKENRVNVSDSDSLSEAVDVLGPLQEQAIKSMQQEELNFASRELLQYQFKPQLEVLKQQMEKLQNINSQLQEIIRGSTVTSKSLQEIANKITNKLGLSHSLNPIYSELMRQQYNILLSFQNSLEDQGKDQEILKSEINFANEFAKSQSKIQSSLSEMANAIQSKEKGKMLASLVSQSSELKSTLEEIEKVITKYNK